MQTLEHRPQHEHKPLGYDIAASVLRLRAEIAEYGYVRPEVGERVYFEELSMVAELINATHDITYNLKQEDGKLLAPDGTPLQTILANGAGVFEELAKQKPELKFWAKRQQDFKIEGEYLHEFARTADSNTVYVSISPYPEEAAALYGPQIFEEHELGPDPKVKKSFVYLYQPNGVGGLRQRVLILEQSTKQEMRHLLRTLQVHVPDNESTDNYLKYGAHISNANINTVGDALIIEYDTEKYRRTGRQTHMGNSDVNRVDGWEFLHKHKHIYLKHYEYLVELAKSNKNGDELRSDAKTLTAGFWSLIKEYLEHERSSGQKYIELIPNGSVGEQMTWALNRAVARGGTFSGGCVSLTLASMQNMDEAAIAAMIFGQDPSKWEWRKGYCGVKNCPTRPDPTKVGPCDVCVGCQTLFDAGKDPVREYAARKPGSRKHQSNIDAFTYSWQFWFSNYS